MRFEQMSGLRFTRYQPKCWHDDDHIACPLQATWTVYQRNELVGYLCAWHKWVWQQAQTKAEQAGIVQETA